MFEKGDIVEVVKSHPGNRCCPAIKKGNRHIVNGLRKCKGCGNVYLDIGFALLTSDFISECACGTVVPSKEPNYQSTFFRKIEPEYRTVEISESINKQVKELVYN